MKERNEGTPRGLFAVDVDGTLLTDSGCITDSVYRSLEKAVSLGWELVIASGRTYYAVRDIAERLPFLHYAVMSNGACIMDVRDVRVLHMEKLSGAAVEKALGVMRSRGAIPVLFTADVLNQRVYYDTLEDACGFFRWYVTNDERCERIDDIGSYTGDVLQIGSIAVKDVIFRVREELDGDGVRVMALPFESPSIGGKNMDYWFLQVVALGATKHAALERLAAMLEIPEGRLVAVGDNYNDAEMISRADIGVAMGNAPPEIKKMAKIVVGSNNRSGLVDVVDEVILSGKYFPEPD